MPSDSQSPVVSEHPLDWQRDRKQIARAAGIVTAAVIVAALYFASEVLIPITLAALLTFILAPLVNLLRHIHIPRVPAIIATVLVALGIIIGIGAVIGTQVADLAGQLPNYQSSLETKLAKLRETTISPLSRAVARFESRSEQSSQNPGPGSSSATNSTSGQKPIPVVIQQSGLSPIQVGEKVL